MSVLTFPLLIIILICVFALLAQRPLVTRQTALDKCRAGLSPLLRERADLLCALSEGDESLEKFTRVCESCRDAEPEPLISRYSNMVNMYQDISASLEEYAASNEAAAALLKELLGMETMLDSAVNAYNEAARSYNAAVKRWGFVAAIFSHKYAELIPH